MTPRRLWALVCAAGCAAVLLCGISAAAALGAPRPPLVHLVAVVAVVVVGDLSLLRIRVGHNGNSFTWAEASLVLGVAIGGWDWLIALGTATILVRQLLAGRAAHKALYNAGALATGAVLGRAGYWMVTGTWDRVGGVSWHDTLGLLVAAAVYFLWVSFAVALAVAWAQDMPFNSVWQRGSGLRLVMFAGNSAAGLMAVLVGDWNRPTVVVLPFFFLLLYFAYNNYLRAQQERDIWRALHTTTLDLHGADTAAVIDAVRRGADELFGSELTEVVPDDDARVGAVPVPALAEHAAAATQPTTVRAARATSAVRAELAALGIDSAVLAPLSSLGQRRGFLLLGFRGPVHLKAGERGVLATLANQTSVSLQQARLFEELSTERSRLDAIVQSASDGIALVDARGHVCAWNPAMVRLTRRSDDDVLGRPLGTALGSGHADGVDDAGVDGGDLVAALASQDDVRVSCVVAASDGTRREAMLAASAVRDRDGACEFAVIVARDVTTQREVEQAKQEFIASVSHELRTPLTPIKGYLTLLLRPDFQPDEAKRHALLRIMLDQAAQLERLVDDLLSVSRMQHGQFDVHLRSADVSDVVRRAAGDIQAGTDRPIHIELPDQPLPAVCDPARLQQVLSNLISNADKYSPAGLPVHVCARDDGEHVRIAVRDHGPGIPLDSREVVFEPFRRLSDRHTRETRGTGLGLHITRQLVTAMHGRVYVDGEPGEGATFHVVLPTAAAGRDARVPEQREVARAS